MRGFSKGNAIHILRLWTVNSLQVNSFILYTYIYIYSLEKPSFVGNFPFSLTCLSCKYAFSLCKSGCVWQWVTGILMDSGFKYKDIPILLHKKPNSWQSLGWFGSLPMSSRTQGLSTLYSAFWAGWLLFSHLVRHGHKMVSTHASVTAPPSQVRDKKRGGGGSTFSSCTSLLSRRKLFLRSPRR